MLSRRALTGLGEVEYSRRGWRCADRQCGAFLAPVDLEVGLGVKEHATGGARGKMALAGATDSYGEAAKLLKELAHLEACPKAIQRVTKKEGLRAQALLEAQESEIRRLVSPQGPPPLVLERHETLSLQMDGTCALTQRSGPRKRKEPPAAPPATLPENPVADFGAPPGPPASALPENPAERCLGKEVKCATVFGLDQRAPRPFRPMLGGRRYAASSLGIESFASAIFALLLSFGGRQARCLVVLGDGAGWIWKWVNDWLGTWRAVMEIIEIVDFWHAAEHLHELALAVFSNPGQARSWFDQWRHRLRQGQIDDLLGELKRLAGQWKSGQRREACENQYNYFFEHRNRMKYAEFEAKGLPIGSGAIEGTCKTLIKKRMAGGGMHWEVSSIEPMTALRTVLFNDDWELLFPNAA